MAPSSPAAGTLRPAFEELPSDQHTSNFVRSGADRVKLCVSEDTPGGELVDIAVAAEGLDRLEAAVDGALGRVQQAGRGVDARAVARVVVLRDPIRERAR